MKNQWVNPWQAMGCAILLLCLPFGKELIKLESAPALVGLNLEQQDKCSAFVRKLVGVCPGDTCGFGCVFNPCAAVLGAVGTSLLFVHLQGSSRGEMWAVAQEE